MFQKRAMSLLARFKRFPILNALTRPLRQAAGRAGLSDGLSLWAGQALPLARSAPAAEIVRRLAAGWRG